MLEKDFTHAIKKIISALDELLEAIDGIDKPEMRPTPEVDAPTEPAVSKIDVQEILTDVSRRANSAGAVRELLKAVDADRLSRVAAERLPELYQLAHDWLEEHQNAA